jgi:hypothetical protein
MISLPLSSANKYNLPSAFVSLANINSLHQVISVAMGDSAAVDAVLRV